MNKEGYLDEEESIQYAEWLIHKSDTPIDEVEWLVSKLPLETCNEIRDTVLKFIKENNYVV